MKKAKSRFSADITDVYRPATYIALKLRRAPRLVFIAWYIILGCLLVSMALTGSWVKRLPLTTALLYLGAGILLGRHGSGLIELDFKSHAVLWERMTEAAILVSLFSAGLKLRVEWGDERWRMALRLAFGAMLATVAMITAAGYYLLSLPLGAALLLGAVLAPTDPVLASDVQVAHAGDRDRLRFSLTGEAGMNDGSAFPFLMLALGLLGLHEIGPLGLRWVAVDLLWGVTGGVAVGAGLGIGVGKVVLYFRRVHKEALGLDDFLALGLIALAYGTSLLLHTYGFLAVFAAGVALRRIESASARFHRDCPRTGSQDGRYFRRFRSRGFRRHQSGNGAGLHGPSRARLQ